MLSIIVFQIWSSRIHHASNWLPIILIIMSNDIKLNPGPHFHNSFFSFMSWNLNSLTKDDFKRVHVLEAHNTLLNYDIITNLNDSINNPDPLLNDFTFISANSPTNKKRGGVGIFYKNSLPAVIRNDLSFDESIVIELRFGRKKIFVTALYRSPSFSQCTIEFQNFIRNLELLYYNNIKIIKL